MHLPDVFEQQVRFSEEILKTGIFYNLIDRDIKPGQSFTTYGWFLEIFKRFTSLKSKVSRNLKVTNTNGFHLAGVSGGVVLQIQSSNINPMNGNKISGYLICTFSNPLVGVVKSQVSLFKSKSVQPEATSDMMLEQYWYMNDFYEERNTKLLRMEKCSFPN